MNLLIHDLNETEWARIAPEYEGWNVISDSKTIHPCMGTPLPAAGSRRRASAS